MRIAFVGKGGSGKTTLASLFSKFLAEQSLPVLAIDADINQHLGQSLGMPGEVAAQIPPLGLEMKRIKEYLRGENPRIKTASSMMKTTPPGIGSRLMKFNEPNPVSSYFERKIGNIRLMTVGEFTEEDLGVHCYHSKTGSVELILNHLIDQQGEYVVVDMTAGADSFASGLFAKFDVVFLVVEPTLKSVSVYHQYKKYAAPFGVEIKSIGNKVVNQLDKEFLQKAIGKDLIAMVSASDYIRATEQGEKISFTRLEQENTFAMEAILNVVNATQKDWKKFYSQMIEFHIRNAQSWANASAGEDLTLQVDPNFSFDHFIQV